MLSFLSEFPGVKIDVLHYEDSYPHCFQQQSIHDEMAITTICRDIKGKNIGNENLQIDHIQT